MNKKGFIRCAVGVLKNGNVRKEVSIPPNEFHISDKYGNEETFIVPGRKKTAIYTAEDVESILNALLCVAEEAVKRGEEINIRGFGKFGVRYRKARRTKAPGTTEWCDVAGRYVPYFQYGEDLRCCARQYEQTVSNGDTNSDVKERHNIEAVVDVSKDTIQILNISDEVSFEEFFRLITGEQLSNLEVQNGD